MKTRKKRLFSILICVAMLATMIPMSVFAADETQLTAETDGVAKHYEVKSENGVGLTHIANDITYPDAPVYKISAHDFCDVGDTSTVSIRDLVDNSYVYSDNFDTGSFDYMDADTLSATSEESLQRGIKNYISLGFGYKNGSADFNKYTYLLKIDNNTYIVKDKELKASLTPAAFSENSYYGTGDILWYIDSHNAVLGTSLPAVVHNPVTDVLDLSQAKFDKIDIVIYKNGSVVETHNFKDLLDKPISINTAFTYNSDFKLNADGTITVKVDSTMSLNTQFKGENTDAWHTVVNNEYEGNRKVYTLDAVTVSELQAIRTTVATYNGNILYAVLDTTNVSAILEYYETIKNNPVQPQVQTVTVTPTVSVVDMPADGTKTEGFDITFKSNVPVVLTTQEAPDTSVCSITTKQSDGSYTGVYHVGEVGNTSIKFNVKPTVASTMSDDGLTKTVYNSTSYTLKINAFAADYETPDDITDDSDEGVIDDDDVITEVPEGDTPSGDDTGNEGDNRPGNIPATGDSTNITLYLVIMLASLTMIVFCVRHKSKAKKALMIILVCAMIGGSIAGPSMVPTTAYAADENLRGSSGAAPGGSGNWAGDMAAANTGNAYVYYLFTIADKSAVDTFVKEGCTKTAKILDYLLQYNAVVGSRHPSFVYDAAKSQWGLSEEAAKGCKWNAEYLKKGCWVFCQDSSTYLLPGQVDFVKLSTFCDIVGFNKANFKPDIINSPTTESAFSGTATVDASHTSMAQLMNLVASETDRAKKVAIAKALFPDRASSITEEALEGKLIVCMPVTLTYNYDFQNKSWAQSYLYPLGYYHYSGQPIYSTANCWSKSTSVNGSPSGKVAAKNVQNRIYINTYWGGLENINQANMKYRGFGTMFTTAPDVTAVKYTKLTRTAYSANINYVLDNKNTIAQTTTHNNYIMGSNGMGPTADYADPTGKVVFTHTYTRKDTCSGSVITKSEYIDGVVEGVTYTDGKTYTKAGTPTYSQTTTGSFSTPSGTLVKSNSVFNNEGYAVWTGASSYAPYLEYKWVASSTGGIGNKYSLEITSVKPGIYYSSTQSQFLSVANYKSYNSNTIPTLANQLSYLTRNASVSGTNRFSGYTGSKFAANLASNTYKFTDYNNTQTTGVYSQATGKTQGIATATYTPINVTSKIVMVDLEVKDNKVVVKSVADGTSKTYSNQSSTTFTTPAGYTYYKATAYGTANPTVGSEVTSSGLTTCNNTTLTVGSSAIDKGYTIFCYKIISGPESDNSPFNYNIASYVKENYVNNIDFVYTDYNSGWKHAATPTVSGSLNTIYNNWTSKINTIIPGCVEANVDTVSKLAHQRTFLFNVNRSAYQTLNLSPFISGMNSFANTNGLAGISAQVSTNKSGVTTMNSGTTVSGSAPNRYNNYYGVTNKTVFKPTGTLIGQPNIWKGTTDAFTISGFTFNRAKITYNNTTYVGVYTAPSIGTQSVTNKDLVAAGKTYAEVSNTGVKLSFVPHYEMRVMKTGDTTSPYNYAGRVFNRVSVMSNYQRSFNAAMLSGYKFDSLVPSGSTVSDYVDNSGDTLKGSDMTLTVTDTGLRFNTYAYVLDIYGDGDANEKINGYNPASQWGINSYSSLVSKVNAKFSGYASTAQNNLAYSVTLNNEGKKYNDFTVSKANATINSSVTTDSNVYQLTVKNGAIVNDTAYQNMLKQIKSDFSLASTTEAETMFKNSGIVDMIMNSMHTSAAANNTSTDKWYDEGTNTICIRRFAKEGMKVSSNLVVQDKVDYDSKTGDAEWSLTIKNGSTVVLEDKIKDAEFEISDKTTQSN